MKNLLPPFSILVLTIQKQVISMIDKKSIMQKEKSDGLLERFDSIYDAAIFWNNHDSADYED